MKKLILLLAFFTVFKSLQAQKVESIHFNLYTDSLKKGFYNYINIDAKLSDGNWQPLDSADILFTANTGFFKGNDLFIDSSFKGDKIVVRAVLKKNPAVWKETTIYIRKRGFDEPLKTGEEMIEDLRSNQRKKKKERLA